MADGHRAAARFRLIRSARRAGRIARTEAPVEPITIRQGTEADVPAIAKLAELESKPAPAGRPLVAIQGGRLQAVLDPDTGEVLADSPEGNEPARRNAA